MRWCVAAVLVFSQPRRAATSRTQGQLCGTAGYSRCRPVADLWDGRLFGRIAVAAGSYLISCEAEP